MLDFKKCLFSLIVMTINLLMVERAFALPVLNPDNGHYYEAVSGNFDWEEAKLLSSSSSFMGAKGHLATLTSSKENYWAWENLGHPFRFLLGASDYDQEGSWKWVTGEEWKYTNWNSIGLLEPSNGPGYEEDALSFDEDGTWNDLPYTHDIFGDGGTYVLGYVAEYEPVVTPVPEPSTMFLFGAGLVGAFLRRRVLKA